MPQKLNLALAALIYALVAIGHGHCTELNTGTKSSRVKHVMEMSIVDQVCR